MPQREPEFLRIRDAERRPTGRLADRAAVSPPKIASWSSGVRRRVDVLAAATKGAAAALNPVPRQTSWPREVNCWAGDHRRSIPVVLVPGSFVPGQFYWHRMAPALAADGHPVFACNLPGLGTRRVGTLAAALATFADDVRAATGSSSVILVGQSFGGVVIRHMLQGNSSGVAAVIAISSQNQGFRPVWGRALRSSLGRRTMSVVCPMALQLVPDGPYLASLNATQSHTVPITTIATVYDVFTAAPAVAVEGGTNLVSRIWTPRSAAGT